MFAVNTVLPCKLTLWFEVREQQKTALPIVRKGQVRLAAVDRDPDQFGIESGKLGKNFVVERHLIGAHRASVRRIEREDHGSPAKFAEGHQLIRRGRKGELWGLGSGGERGICAHIEAPVIDLRLKRHQQNMDDLMGGLFRSRPACRDVPVCLPRVIRTSSSLRQKRYCVS